MPPPTPPCRKENSGGMTRSFSPHDERREHPTLVIPAKLSRGNLTRPPRRCAPPLLKRGGANFTRVLKRRGIASPGDDEFAEPRCEHRRQVRRPLPPAEEVA